MKKTLLPLITTVFLLTGCNVEVNSNDKKDTIKKTLVGENTIKLYSGGTLVEEYKTKNKIRIYSSGEACFDDNFGYNICFAGTYSVKRIQK